MPRESFDRMSLQEGEQESTEDLTDEELGKRISQERDEFGRLAKENKEMEYDPESAVTPVLAEAIGNVKAKENKELVPTPKWLEKAQDWTYEKMVHTIENIGSFSYNAPRIGISLYFKIWFGLFKFSYGLIMGKGKDPYQAGREMFSFDNSNKKK